jgi:nucleotide-binding universal stress UspA family protein
MTTQQPVLVAYDGSEGAKHALQEAARLFEGHELIVASVGRSVAGVGAAGVVGLPAGVAGEAVARLDEEVTQEVEATAAEGAGLADAAGARARSVGTLSAGGPWSALLRLADDYDVAAVVVGSRGRSQAAGLVLGSVSAALVHRSTRPVVVVPAEHGS